MTKELMEYHLNKLKQYYQHTNDEFPPEGNEYSLFIICLYILEKLNAK